MRYTLLTFTMRWLRGLISGLKVHSALCTCSASTERAASCVRLSW